MYNDGHVIHFLNSEYVFKYQSQTQKSICFIICMQNILEIGNMYHKLTF